MTDMGKKELLRLIDEGAIRPLNSTFRMGDKKFRKLILPTMRRWRKIKAIVEQWFDKGLVIGTQIDTEQPPEPGVDEEKKIEEIRMMIQKATSEYMPVFRRIILNDAVEVEIRKLLTQQKRTVTREWLEHKAEYLVERFDGECSLTTLQCIGIMTVLTEKGDMEDLLEELGIEVITKK